MKQYVTMDIDVLILGAGAAGIRAALAASEEGAQVIIISSGHITDSGSTFSKIAKGWGIQALIRSEQTDENLQAFYNDVIQAGLGQCDSKLVQILVEESGVRLEDLISHGIRLKQDQCGEYLRVKGCFSDSERAFLTDDFENIRQTFRSIYERSSARILKGYALDLIISEDTCWGAWIVANPGEIIRITAKATILATGGGAGVYKDHLVSDNDVGDGYALAHRAGAQLTNMEFVQFMLGLKNNGSRIFLPVTSLQKPGVMCDAEGLDLMEIFFPDVKERADAVEKRKRHYPFSCRDSSYQIDVAIARTREGPDNVYWVEDGSKYQETKVVHFAHAFNGGVKIDEKAETTIAGLYAAGEVAAGPHGADRVGGCMMTATQVFGRRAGSYAGQCAKKVQRIAPLSSSSTEKDLGCLQSKNKNENLSLLSVIEGRIKQAMGRYAGVMRTNDGLKKCNAILEESEKHLNSVVKNGEMNSVKFCKVRNMITTCKLIVDGAILRRESRGSHFREDSPEIVSSV